MTMSRVRTLVLCIFCLTQMNISLEGQSLLSIEQVLSQVEENNYDLQTARQNLATAEVLTSKYNRGYLPTLGLNAGLGYNLNGIKQVFNFNFPDLDIQGIQAGTGNASVTSSYLLYDGGQRRLRNEKNLSNIDFVKLQIDNINQVLGFNASQFYYSIAQAMYNIDLLSESLAISNDRLRRAKTYYEYGNQSKVDVLNAEVDVARDSLNLISVKNDIENLKWQLNQLILRDDADYQVDTSFTLMYQLSDFEELKDLLLASNIELIALKKNIELVQYDAEIASKINSPEVLASGAYSLNYQKNSSISQIDLNRSNGLNLGVSANWNILDGGQRKVQEQLAVINQQSANIELKSKENELTTQLNRLWNSYRNNLLTMGIEKQNIETNKVNFELVKTLFENGQQSSVEFRQAQLNLINAQSQYYIARTSAKLLELELDYLLGK